MRVLCWHSSAAHHAQCVLVEAQFEIQFKKGSLVMTHPATQSAYCGPRAVVGQGLSRDRDPALALRLIVFI